MLKVDHFRRIVFEGYGVSIASLPVRCKEISVDAAGELAEAGYRYYHLSEWVLFDKSTNTVLGDLSYRSPADAMYTKFSDEDLRLDRNVTAVRVENVWNYL